MTRPLEPPRLGDWILTPLLFFLVTRLGIALEAPDRVRVQQNETSIPGIFAAGDLALHHHSALAAAGSVAAAAHALDEGLTQELVLAGML